MKILDSVRSMGWAAFPVVVAGLIGSGIARAEGPDVEVAVSPQESAAAAADASNYWYHLNGADTDAGRAASSLDGPAAIAAPSIRPSFSGASIPSVPSPGFYPADLTKLSSSAHVLKGTVHHLVFVNCSNVTTCWGNPGGFLSDLNKSAFIHVTDQYTGNSASSTNHYPVSSSVIHVTVNNGGAPLGPNDLIAILNKVVKKTAAGYGNIYHLFFAQGQDVCADGGFSQCYSPDNGSTFVFCAFHSSVNLGNGVGHTLFSVEPFQDVNGCQVSTAPHAAPNGQKADSTNSTLSHEVFETITDPDGDAFKCINSLPERGNEIGDECQALAFTNTNGALDPIFKINGHNYEVQAEYSNHYHACATAP